MTPKRCTLTLIFVMALGLTISGCLKNWGEDEYTFGDSREIGVMNMYPGVLTQEGALSIPLDSNRSLWLFGETLLADSSAVGFHALSNSAGVHLHGNSLTGNALEWITDSSDVLKQLIPYTTYEQAWNDNPNHPWDYRYWPVGGIALGEYCYIYLARVELQDYFNAEVNGCILVRLDHEFHAERKFESDYYVIGYSPRLENDGYLYLQTLNPYYQSSGYATRVSPDSIESRSAYRFLRYDYYGRESWDTSPYSNSLSVSTSGTIDYNGYLEGYTRVFQYSFSNEIALGFYNDRYCAFSRNTFNLFAGAAPQELWISNAYQHPEYKRDGGKTILISYWSQQEENGPGLHLVEFEFYD